MNNHELTRDVIQATRDATIAYYNYMYTDREYVEGQNLYLREMHFLLYVGGADEITMSEIAEKMNVTQGAATQIAARLLKKNLIYKHKNPEDKRYSFISLTPEGLKTYLAYLEYDKIRYEEIASCMDMFSEEDIKVILKFEHLIQDICTGKMPAK